MSTDFDRAVNFLQGALDIAARETSEPETTAPEQPTAPEPTAVEAPPTPAEDAACPCCADKPRSMPRGKLAASLIVALCAGIAIVAAHKIIHPRVVTQTIQKEPDGIPLTLLPDHADASLWDIVSSLHGEINGTPVVFTRGLAETSAGTFKLDLDFCRIGGTIYAKVRGPENHWVVTVADDGTIRKVYPTRTNSKPLREVFGK